MKKNIIKVRGNIWSMEVPGSPGLFSLIQPARVGAWVGWRGETWPGSGADIDNLFTLRLPILRTRRIIPSMDRMR